MVNSYLNGPRYLSDDKLSSLIISTDESSFAATSPTHDEAGEEIKQSYHFMLVTTHFLGDGMALHLTANEFFLLLAGKTPTIAVDAPVPSETSIERVLRGEEGKGVEMEKMAQAMESKLPTNEKWGRLAWAGAKVEFDLDQAKLVVRPLPSRSHSLANKGWPHLPPRGTRHPSHPRPDHLLPPHSHLSHPPQLQVQRGHYRPCRFRAREYFFHQSFWGER